jgi:hypothetical protein
MAESSGMGLAGGLGMFALQMAEGNGLRAASVQRAGVAEIGGYNGTILVNQDNLVELIEAEVKKLKPVTDYNGKFAARVFIQVELLGDQDPSVFDGWKTEEGKQEEENNG